MAGAYRDSQNACQNNLNQIKSDLINRKETLELNSETVAELHQITTILSLFNDGSSTFSKTILDKIDVLSSQQNLSNKEQAKLYAEESEKLNDFFKRLKQKNIQSKIN